ncbi:MAG: adenylate/guanylate cyclase domain-containing protein [Candidatus Methylomirabilales bacterium]
MEGSAGRQLLHGLARSWHRAVNAGVRVWHQSMPKRFPIAYKLALAITILITGSMALLGVAIVNDQFQLLSSEIDAFGRTVVDQIAGSAKEMILTNDTLGLKVLTTNLASDERILGTAIFGQDGKVLAQSGVTPLGESTSGGGQLSDLLDVSPHTLDWQWRESSGKSLRVVSFVTPVSFKDVVVGHVLITFSRSAIDQSLMSSVRRISIVTLSMIVLAIVMSFIMARQFSRPIHRLVDASRAIGEGEFEHRIHEKRADEIGDLMTAFNTMAQGLLEKTKVESAFSRFVSNEVAKQVLSDLGRVELGGRHVYGSVLFADIVGFTSMSDRMAPRAVAELLNEYFSYISQASDLYRGLIDKYIGDCAMMVFGIPEEDSDHCFHAIACAVLIQRAVENLNIRRAKRGLFEVQFRMGLSTGEMVAGTMGSQTRMQYTVVGETVNLASRLCAVAQAGQIVISEEMYAKHGIDTRILADKHEVKQLKGMKFPVTTYLVKDVSPSYRHVLDQQVAMVLTGEARA